MRAILALLVRTYWWGYEHPTSITYGVVLLFGAKVGAGNLLFLALGIISIAAGVLGLWDKQHHER